MRGAAAQSMSRRISASACSNPSSMGGISASCPNSCRVGGGGGGAPGPGVKNPGHPAQRGGWSVLPPPPSPRDPVGGVSARGSACPMPACACGGPTTGGLQIARALGPSNSSQGSSAHMSILVPQKPRGSSCCGCHGDAAPTASWPPCVVSSWAVRRVVAVAAAAHSTADAAHAAVDTGLPTWASGGGPKRPLCPRASQGTPRSSPPHTPGSPKHPRGRYQCRLQQIASVLGHPGGTLPLSPQGGAGATEGGGSQARERDQGRSGGAQPTVAPH